MKHKIDPRIDCVFKALLGNEKRKNLLIHFLNGVLERTGTDKITDADILNPYNEREFTDDKLGVVDIKAKDLNGNFYQIEIQLVLHAGLNSRILYSWSSIYHSQIGKGDDFTQLKPVISIWILNHKLFEKPEAYHLPFSVYSKTHDISLNDHLSIHIIQLPEWRYPERLSEKDRWLYLFKEGRNIDWDDPPDALKTEDMREVTEVMKQFSENQRNYLMYQSRCEALSVFATMEAEKHRAIQWAEKEAMRADKEAKLKEAAIKQADNEAKRAEKEAKRAEKEAKRAEKEAKEKEAALKRMENEAKEKEAALLRLKQLEEEIQRLKMSPKDGV